MGVAGGADEFYGLGQSRVGGDAVEVEELEGSHAECGGDGGGERVGTLEEGGDAGVEGDLPAEDAEDKGVGEVAVGLREGGHGGAVEEVVGVGGRVGYTEEDGEGGGAGGGDGGVREGLCKTLRRCRFSCRFLRGTIVSR
jgi:hypothetical protein